LQNCFHPVFGLVLELFLLLFFLQQRAVLHNVVILTTLETPSELFPATVSGLVQVLPFRVLLDLLEELLEGFRKEIIHG